MATIRIATVKAIGRRYIVQKMDFVGPVTLVYCWNEVTKIGARVDRFSHKHRPGAKQFNREEVDVETIPMTWKLLNELIEQTEAIDAASEKAVG